MQKQVITTITGKQIPAAFTKLHQPPSKLQLLGNTKLLTDQPRVGIVGARKFTPYGREVTTTIAGALAREGVVIVSGLALGVDSIAHKACLDNSGQTIAVLPSGLKSIYPASHTHLAREIIDKQGLLVSEYPEKFRPHKISFLERNRLIAALSDVLIITEAAVASGSLNTASHALELGIPIMAVPGNIDSPYSKGTNNLIRTGAHPLLEPKDVLELLNIQPKSQLSYIPETEAEAAILNALKSGVSATNDLIKAAGLEVEEAQVCLTMLEMKGVLAVQAGNWRIRQGLQ